MAAVARMAAVTVAVTAAVRAATAVEWGVATLEVVTMEEAMLVPTPVVPMLVE